MNSSSHAGSLLEAALFGKTGSNHLKFIISLFSPFELQPHPKVPSGCGHDWWQGWRPDGPERPGRHQSSWIAPRRGDLLWPSGPLLVSCSLSKRSSFWKGRWREIIFPPVFVTLVVLLCIFWIKDLLGNILKDSDPKADPLTPHHTVLEAGEDGWNEVLDMGEAARAHTPWLIYQEHNVRLRHRPARWEMQ